MLDLHGTRGAGMSLGIAAAAAGLGLLVALLRMRKPARTGWPDARSRHR